MTNSHYFPLRIMPDYGFNIRHRRLSASGYNSPKEIEWADRAP
jgi:hypothetical protein